MFDLEEICDLWEQGAQALRVYMDQNPEVSSEEIARVFRSREQVLMSSDQYAGRFSKSESWLQEGFTSAKNAIMAEVHVSHSKANKAVARGELLNDYPEILRAAEEGLITTDHLDQFLRISDPKYREYFRDHLEMLIANASAMTPAVFSVIITQWRNSINDLLNEESVEYKHFKERYLEIYQDADGQYIVEARLDTTNGMFFEKALEDISQQLRSNTDSNEREEYTKAQRYADAAGSLGQGYINHAMSAHDSRTDPHNPQATQDVFTFSKTPALTADVTVNITDLDPAYSTHSYLKRTLNSTSPINRAHSSSYIDQLLCDTELRAPVIHEDGSIDLGRTARTAPWKLKKLLILTHKTCSAPGCTIPANWCDAHHIEHWAYGGETNLDNLMLLCRRHHTILHNNPEFEQKLKNTHAPPIMSSG
ncbi:MAG TPA: DUF222 domain-containing protein [Acidimicrobiia bacterium]|nr:DUF222 domain-containing protein [Acidimicrobiia bacterium]